MLTIGCVLYLICFNLIKQDWKAFDNALLSLLPLMFVALIEFAIFDYPILHILGLLN